MFLWDKSSIIDRTKAPNQSSECSEPGCERGMTENEPTSPNTRFTSSPKVASPHLRISLCAKLLMVRTMLQSTKTFDTKLVRYIEWSNVQPCVHHISPIWPHYGHFGPKNSHIWPYLAIGSPSCPKLVEHWLNMVEHRSPHLGWATWTPLHSPK